MKSRSVFERITSLQPRSRSSASAAGTSRKTGQPGSERAESVALVLGQLDAGGRGAAREDLGEDLAVRRLRRRAASTSRLELVVAGRARLARSAPKRRASSSPMPPFQSTSVP